MSPCDGPEESKQAGQQGPVVRGFVPVRGGVGVVGGEGAMDKTGAALFRLSAAAE